MLINKLFKYVPVIFCLVLSSVAVTAVYANDMYSQLKSDTVMHEPTLTPKKTK
jgi:hypothetical protein